MLSTVIVSLLCLYTRKFICQGGNVGHYSINELISDEIINSISCKIRKYLASSVTIIRMIPCKGTVLYCTVLYCTVLYCTVLYCTVLYCTVLYCTVLYCTVLYCTVLYCTVLYCTVLYCTVLYCTVLYCTVLYCTVLVLLV